MNDRSEDTGADDDVTYRGTGFYVSVALIIITAAVLLVFAVQNSHEVGISFLGYDLTVPLFAVVIGAALATVVLDQLIGLVWRRHRRHRLEELEELKRLRRKVGDGSEPDRTSDEDSAQREEHQPTAS